MSMGPKVGNSLTQESRRYYSTISKSRSLVRAREEEEEEEEEENRPVGPYILKSRIWPDICAPCRPVSQSWDEKDSA